MRQIRYAVEAAIDVVQIRERDLDADALAAIVHEAVSMTRGTRTRVVVNDRLDVALAAGADGVHLRHDSIPAESARMLAPRGFLIGCSVQSACEALQIRPQVDYVIAGTVWPSASKPELHQKLGTAGLADVVNATRLPVLAIGGVTLERVADVAAAKAAGVAAIGMFMDQAQPASMERCRAIPLSRHVAEARLRFDTSGSPS